MVLLLVAAGAPSKTSDLIWEADRLRAAGDLAGSLALVRQAYALDPSPALLNNLGVLLESLGKYREAADAFDGVAKDARAPASLRELDSKRRDALAPKLTQAWLVASVAPPDATMLLDGEPLARSQELAIAPGRHPIEMYHLAAGEVVCRFVALPAGERTTFAEDLAKTSDDDAWIVLEGAARPITALAIDDYRLRAPIFTKTKIVRVASGTYRLLASRSDGPPVNLEITLAPGETLALARHPKLAPPAAAPPKLVEPAIVAAPPKTGVGPLPFVLMGAGVLAIAGGSTLQLMASADRDEVSNAARDARGVITGLTFARAGELEDGANTKANAGAVFLASGAAIIATGFVWWLVGGDVLD